jgi:quercetin 2,3-dioxygenase
MAIVRAVSKTLQSKKIVEGAGVRVRRVFGFTRSNEFDPFLLLDDFRSVKPEEYLSGFPWHPHRGIETITYMISGTVEHGDSLGNCGVIGAGDVQWMTAGSGIIHQEMPKGDPDGKMGGFQLWTNLPSASKMMDPRYRDIPNRSIPEISPSEGTIVRVIAGKVGSSCGPVSDIVTEPEYLDVTMKPDSEFLHATPPDHTVLAYVIQGEGCFSEAEEPVVGGMLVHFGGGDEIAVKTFNLGVRFLLLSGKPIGEPVAWYGPVVMNTEAELRQAFEEYRTGKFVKHTRQTEGKVE